jgi:hypothetical protein
VDFVHKNSLNYEGLLKETYEHSQEVSYNFSNYTAAIGHSNGGNVLDANGDLNIELTSTEGSTLYSYLLVTF